jgi:hypothetical protein
MQTILASAADDRRRSARSVPDRRRPRPRRARQGGSVAALVGPGGHAKLLSLELRQLGVLTTRGRPRRHQQHRRRLRGHVIWMPISPEVAEAAHGALRGLKDGWSRWVDPLTPPTSPNRTRACTACSRTPTFSGEGQGRVRPRF